MLIDVVWRWRAQFIEREDFFGPLFDLLKAQPEITNLHAVPDAHTPIMKMEFANISVRQCIYYSYEIVRILQNKRLMVNEINRLRTYVHTHLCF